MCGVLATVGEGLVNPRVRWVREVFTECKVGDGEPVLGAALEFEGLVGRRRRLEKRTRPGSKAVTGGQARFGRGLARNGFLKGELGNRVRRRLGRLLLWDGGVV